MTEVERSESGGGGGRSDFCFRAVTASGPRARPNHADAPARLLATRVLSARSPPSSLADSLRAAGAHRRGHPLHSHA